MTPQEKANIKGDFEVLFNDSPDYFAINNANMVQEEALIRFIYYDSKNQFKEDVWYPISKLHRIKRY